MHSTRIVIIGGGFSGIGIAIRLRQQGIDDFVILERAADPGGTWRDNRYPGCACDVQSSLYSFSFAPNPDWSRTYSPQAEIWAYLQRCVAEFDLARHFRFGQDVIGAAWDDSAQHWRVSTRTGTWSAQVMVMAGGGLSDPVVPVIDGLDSFAGRAFHSSQWDHTVDLRGRRVAVIGTGASAIQFVPRIQPIAAHVSLFQRTPPWVLPRHDRAVPAWRRSLYRAVPLTQKLERAALYAMREGLHFPFRHRWAARVVEGRALQHLRAQVADPMLRVQLTPHYRIGCKRILVSDDFYPAVAASNVALVTQPIARVVPDGVVTTDGVHHAADVLILGTGFRATDPPLAPVVTGRAGASLAEVWQGSPRAYMGISEAGFPNLFFLLGPNTALGHSSVLLMVEAQIAHILGVLQLMRERGAGAAEPLAAAQAQFVADVDRRNAATTWNTGGCGSWYLDRTGRNAALWPDGVGRYRRAAIRVRAEDYHLAAAVSE